MSVFVALKFDEGTGKHFIGGVYDTRALANEDLERKTKQALDLGLEPSTLVALVEKELVCK